MNSKIRYDFHLDTPIAQGLKELVKKIETEAELNTDVKMVIAGGMAVHLYTASRVTTDVDAEFDKRVLLPGDLIVEKELEGGEKQAIYFDTTYNSTFAIMHEDYMDDAIPVDLGLKHIKAHVLSPVDLVLSKLSRFADNDREDIETLLEHGLTTAEEINQRALEALPGYVGSTSMLLHNINDTVDMALRIEAAKKKTNDIDYSPTP